MKAASGLYRIAAVLLVLFAIGHTLGFRQNIPEWGASSVIEAMQSIHFNAQGFDRTHWDFFSAYAFTTPIIFSVLISICLIAATWLRGKKSA